jgi:hypothetical protein
MKYQGGGSVNDEIHYTTLNLLTLKDPDFEKTFALIANTIFGAAAMDGDERAIDTL